MNEFSEDLGYEILKNKVYEKVRKNDPRVGIGKMKTKTWFVNFFKCSLNFRAHALKLKHNKVSISNFIKFRLQIMSSKIERVFEKIKHNFPLKSGQKGHIYGIYKDHKSIKNSSHEEKKHIFFCVRMNCYIFLITPVW